MSKAIAPPTADADLGYFLIVLPTCLEPEVTFLPTPSAIFADLSKPLVAKNLEL